MDITKVYQITAQFGKGNAVLLARQRPSGAYLRKGFGISKINFIKKPLFFRTVC